MKRRQRRNGAAIAPVAAEVLEFRELLSATAAAHLVMLSAPSTGTACGAGHNLGNQYRFALTDSNGNVVKSDNSTVTLSIVSGPAGEDDFGPCTFPSMQAQNGVVTFSQVTFYKTGVYIVKATDSNPAIPAVTLPPVTIVAGQAEQLAIQAPTTGMSGKALGTVHVAVEDKYGNVRTSDNSTVITLGLFVNGNTTSAVKTVSARVVNGVATFNNVVVPAAGNYRLQATANTLPQAFGGVAWSDQAGITVLGLLAVLNA